MAPAVGLLAPHRDGPHHRKQQDADVVVMQVGATRAHPTAGGTVPGANPVSDGPGDAEGDAEGRPSHQHGLLGRPDLAGVDPAQSSQQRALVGALVS